jgi:hypothetical protein
MKSMNQSGGQMPALGGAVMVQILAMQLNAGKSVLLPIVLPCVLDEAPMIEIRRFDREPDVTVIW